MVKVDASAVAESVVAFACVVDTGHIPPAVDKVVGKLPVLR